MREIYKGGVTPQQKLVAINNKFGNTSVKRQQGTSRIIYDSLPTGTNTTFRFFEDSASRNFPFTNTGSDGNKLGVGDTMVIQSVLFCVFTKDTVTGEITNVESLSNFFNTTNNLAIFNFEIANNKVLKNVAVSEQSSAYSKQIAAFNNDIELETLIVLPPLLPYILELRLPLSLPPAPELFETFIQAQIIGVGSLIAPRTTF